MARPSSSKKVSRAAQTGGGRTKRGTQGWMYWAVIALIVVLGVVGVGYSRQERRADLASDASNVPPIVGQDHWHTAYGIYICDQFLEPFTDQRDPEGIHTHGDGVIHIHPIVRRAAGTNARLSKFFDAIRADFSDTEIEIPGGETYTEGDDECDGEPGVMQLIVKGRERPVTTDLRDFLFDEDRQVVTIAFAPEGADIPLPPSEATLDNLSDVGTTASTTVTFPGDSTSTTAEGSSETTSPSTSAAPSTTSP